ncbi:cytochrome c oxidase subunit 3 [Rubinisphaera margarita]|uniref:cytochrome c oxidase subunit 3 n=1 Tax=Rubinisphaera margarita TaxID=2909586 RepID=UPI001EE792AF|nr:cytochrome c oxidase subunit 3 [Rubinisphaera margarita]MCG6157190.1 cytochrome c oxidase subunit 3 [Rubinisphaera margarita]
MATAVDPHDEHQTDHGHDDWHHKPFSAHHFDNAEQQFDSGKLGMWLFLVTEVLFFSGLFCAYAVYRANHPEVFIYASQYLDKYLGGMNTIVLIFSSLTMAWGVRCAQLGQNKGLVILLGITLFCAALFLGVKTFEYTEKAHKRLLWAGAFASSEDLGKADAQVFKVGDPLPEAEFEDRVMSSLGTITKYWVFALAIPVILAGIGFGVKSRPTLTVAASFAISIVAIIIGIQVSIAIHHAQHAGDHGEAHAAHDAEHEGTEHGEHGLTVKEGADPGHGHEHDQLESEAKEIDTAAAIAESKQETIAGEAMDPVLGDMTSAGPTVDDKSDHDAPRNANIFFSIYYFMTGLHAFHILCGMIAISWLMVRAVEKHFRPDYFGPVDFVGLYWHIVDLIWIYLFPLLYLIGH